MTPPVGESGKLNAHNMMIGMDMELTEQETAELNAKRIQLVEELTRERNKRLRDLRAEIALVEVRYATELDQRTKEAEEAIKAQRRIVLVPTSDAKSYHSSESPCGFVTANFVEMTEAEALRRGLKRHTYGCHYS